MAHYARVLDGKVQEVIVADQDFIDNLVYDKPGKWIQTSYNTKGGVHVNGGTPLRKNYAGKNWTYDVGRDAFIPPKPYPSWVLNEETANWDAPVAMPEDAGTGDPPKEYTWVEATLSWAPVETPE